MTVLTPRDVPLGGLRAMTVRRTLPHRERRTIGAWCFVDHFGPDRVAETGGMVVNPHPHVGLQTVTWLFAGEVEHRDSVGSLQHVKPGGVNLMTAGRGISHSEVSTPETRVLHGVQLWVALPEAHRGREPFFEHRLAPRIRVDDAEVTVFVGSLAGATSPATTFTPLVGAEILLLPGGSLTLAVDPGFEHGVLVDAGEVSVNGETGASHELVFVAAGARQLSLVATDAPARLLLIGGTPFTEDLLMWWNFVGRTHEEIAAWRQQWEHDVVEGGDAAGTFGQVAVKGAPIPAPELPTVHLRARPSGSTRHTP
jgi:redox-sensitive bicupin YhaK (pirin superfamily)